MSETHAAPAWGMLAFTRVVADALDDSVAAYLRALEDSVANVGHTRARMEMAQRTYYELRRAQDAEPQNPRVCGLAPHQWGPPFLVPDVPVNGVTRNPQLIMFEACPGCGTLRVKTNATGHTNGPWTSHYIRR